jgi:hypothetical protein
MAAHGIVAAPYAVVGMVLGEPGVKEMNCRFVSAEPSALIVRAVIVPAEI